MLAGVAAKSQARRRGISGFICLVPEQVWARGEFQWRHVGQRPQVREPRLGLPEGCDGDHGSVLALGLPDGAVQGQEGGGGVADQRGPIEGEGVQRHRFGVLRVHTLWTMECPLLSKSASMSFAPTMWATLSEIPLLPYCLKEFRPR